MNTLLSKVNLKTRNFVVPLLAVLLWNATSELLCAVETNPDVSSLISSAAVLYQPLKRVGNRTPTLEENRILYAEVQNMKHHGVGPSISVLEKFIADYPDSPWSSSLRANLGCYYFEHGLYTRSLQNWEMVWTTTKEATNGPAKALADFTFAHWTHLLSSLGRVDTLQTLFEETKDRQFDAGPLQALVNEARGGYHMMITHSGICFKCGTFALGNVARCLYSATADAAELMAIPSPTTGFSMTALVELAQKHNLNLVPAQWNDDETIVVPSVVHWKENHYVAVIQETNGAYLTIDPTFGKPRWLTRAEIQEEASGYFLIPKQKLPAKWRVLESSETDEIFGRGYYSSDTTSDGCGNGSGGSDGGGGDDGGGGGDDSGAIGTSPIAVSCSLCGGDGNNDGSATGGGGAGGTCCPPPAQNGGNGNTGGNTGPWAGGDSDSGSGVGATGMPVWEVSEPFINLWIYDQPISYQPGVGYPISFKIAYKQRETRTMLTNFFSFGNLWDCSWLSYIQDTGLIPGHYEPIMLVPGGGERTYTPDNTTMEYYSHTTLQRTVNASNYLTGYVVSYASGAKDYYGFVPLELLDGNQIAFITAKVDPFGHATSFIYQETNDTVLLLYVIDADGRTNTLTYTNTAFRSQITGVQDPFGHSVVLKYNSAGILTNVIDPVSLSSTFQYDVSGWMTNLTTPYGTTVFQYTAFDTNATDPRFGNTVSDGSDDYYFLLRAIKVIDAAGGTNVYMLREDSTIILTNAADFTNFTAYDNDIANGNYDMLFSNTLFFPLGAYQDDSYYDSGIAPQSVPTPTLDNSYLNFRDSFHWGPRQAVGLPDDVTTYPGPAFIKARMKHWLHLYNNVNVISQTLDMKQSPSPDGTTPGQTTWYDYDGKLDETTYWEGTNSKPSLVARVQPDGTTWYRWYQRDQWGRPTNVVDTYSTGSGQTPLTRTNIYIYSTGGADLITHIGPTGNIDDGYAYNAGHELTAYTNAAGEVALYTYDAQGRLTQTVTPAGLTSTYQFFSSGGPYTNWVQSRIVVQINATNTYTYTNDLVRTNTDERGLTTTYAYDGLNRWVSVSSSLGTISYTYNKLDLAQVSDRMGFTTSFGYDAVRRKIAVTNALGNYTLFNYCTCGSLDSFQDMNGFVTAFTYDNAGHRLTASYPDGYTMTYNYDLRGRVTNSIDGAGTSVTNWFNNQGLAYTVSNAFGLILAKQFDIKDRLTNNIDRNGVVISSAYDNLGRMLNRSYPDGGIEHFGYSPAGLIAYTNQLTNATYYTYDAARRKVAETNANHQVTQYAYDAASDLISLTDQKGNITEWGYDTYGRVTNKVDATSTTILKYKYDADNRLTNRWSAQKGNTVYAYDAVGNLASVTYPVSSALAFSYDALNELTNMTDGVGTTAFTYTPAGQLQSETGPWASDTITYTYSDRLRISLDLQQPNAPDWIQSYVYDAANRLQAITSSAGAFAYSYNLGLAGTTSSSSLVANIALPPGAFVTNSFDNNARMLGTSLYNSSGTVLDSSVYTNNVGNQRTSVVRGGENVANYTYDPIGQVIADVASEGSTNRLNEQLHYGFDPDGNLAYRTNNTLVQNFAVNSDNELTTATNGGSLTVVGSTTALANNVTVNGTNASFYGDATFAATNMPLTTTYTAIASDTNGQTATNTVTVSLSTNSTFQYDANGNLTNDGLRCFAYDDENELVQVWETNQWQSKFSYDGKLRRRIRQEYTWSSAIGNWSLTNEVRYVYDGNLVVQERDTNNLPTTTYTRGKDLSGSLEGAGGIGGLLARWTPLSAVASGGGGCFYHADGNGNITMLINASQASVANYLYDAFGNVLAKSGLLAEVNLYRFSSKEVHVNSGLVYYLYRYYDPNLQRWLNRDPIGEKGGINLYDFVMNDTQDKIDIYGQGWWSLLCCEHAVNKWSKQCQDSIPKEPPADSSVWVYINWLELRKQAVDSCATAAAAAIVQCANGVSYTPPVDFPWKDIIKNH